MLAAFVKKLSDPKALKVFIRFCVVGGLTALLYGGATAFFLEVVRADYKVAVSAAYVTAVSFHFLCSRNVTFSAQGKHVGGQLLRYVLYLVFNYGLTLGVAVAAVDLLGLSSYAASALSLVIPMLITFFVMKLWVFAR